MVILKMVIDLKRVVLIKKVRKEKNISLNELSKLTNISKGHLSCIERGEKEPKIWRAMDIAEALDVDVNDIFKTIESKEI